MNRFALLLLAGVTVAFQGLAHEVRPAHLTVTELREGEYLVRWQVPAMGDRRIAIDPVFAADCAATGERADGFAAEASVQSWRISCPEGLAGTEIAFANLAATMIDVLVRVSFLDGRDYTALVRPSEAVFRVPERDGEARVFGSYLVAGVEHILFGWDHLLFVLCLVLLVPDARRLVRAITGFTVAHSFTLALAMLDVVRVSGPPVEAVIALSIVMLAVESIRHRQTGVRTLAIRAPWLVSIAIGLVHGLGFAGALREYGLPAYARFVSLLSFNLGVEIGQLAFVATLILLGALAARFEPRVVSPVRFSATWLSGVCGAFWLVERVTRFFP